MKRLGRIALLLAWIFLVAVLILWIVFHGYAPAYNQPLPEAAQPAAVPPANEDVARGMWPNDKEQDDRALVLVAISGGGTRAAAVGWKALEELKKVEYRFTNPAGQVVVSNLAHEIDLVAGISGGAFAAAAWCLEPEDMARFRKAFIERNIQSALAGNFVSLNGLRAFFSPRYSRINWAAELYDREVYGGKTFAALPQRPILRLHATNLALGQRFTFTPETFANLNSDLSSYPIGYACAASSAFPILLNPMTLRNYPPAADLTKDQHYVSASRNTREDLNRELFVRTRDYYNNKKNEYIHLADGGLVDNQGLQSILDEFETDGIINRRINYTALPLQRLIIIDINAGVAPPNASGETAEPPGIPSVVESTMVASMDVLSARRWMDIKAKCEIYTKAKIDGGPAAESYKDLEEPYRIEISFRNIKDAGDQAKAMGLPTSFALTADQLSVVDKVVPALLAEDPGFQRLKQQLAK